MESAKVELKTLKHEITAEVGEVMQNADDWNSEGKSGGVPLEKTVTIFQSMGEYSKYS